MDEYKDEATLKFLKYWEDRFKLIFEQNTNWTKLFFILDHDNLPNSISIEKFCEKYSQDFQINITYKKDPNTNNFDLTITR
jgi:hypothetical protein